MCPDKIKSKLSVLILSVNSGQWIKAIFLSAADKFLVDFSKLGFPPTKS